MDSPHFYFIRLKGRDEQLTRQLIIKNLIWICYVGCFGTDKEHIQKALESVKDDKRNTNASRAYHTLLKKATENDYFITFADDVKEKNGPKTMYYCHPEALPKDLTSLFGHQDFHVDKDLYINKMIDNYDICPFRKVKGNWENTINGEQLLFYKLPGQIQAEMNYQATVCEFNPTTSSLLKSLIVDHKNPQPVEELSTRIQRKTVDDQTIFKVMTLLSAKEFENCVDLYIQATKSNWMRFGGMGSNIFAIDMEYISFDLDNSEHHHYVQVKQAITKTLFESAINKLDNFQPNANPNDKIIAFCQCEDKTFESKIKNDTVSVLTGMEIAKGIANNYQKNPKLRALLSWLISTTSFFGKKY